MHNICGSVMIRCSESVYSAAWWPKFIMCVSVSGAEGWEEVRGLVQYWLYWPATTEHQFVGLVNIGGDTMQLLEQQFPLTHIPLHAFPSPCVLWELHGAIDFNGKFMRSSSQFSEGSFKVIIYGKLLRFNDIYGVSCLTAATASYC